MAEIFLEKIGTNRYAPEGTNDISLFSYNGAEGLTIGQLINAVCVRRGVYQEKQSVLVMNRLAGETDRLHRLADVTDRLLDATGAWNDADFKFLTEELKIDPNTLPKELNSYKKRMQAFDIARNKLQEINGSVERIAIQLQSTISRRDAIYSVATMMVSHLGKSMAQAANMFR